MKPALEEAAKRQAIEQYQTGLRRPAGTAAKITLTKNTRPPAAPTALHLKKPAPPQ